VRLPHIVIDHCFVVTPAAIAGVTSVKHPTVIDGMRPKVRFATDSPLEEDGFDSRSLREGKGCGQPLQASIAVSDLNL
jgi:hypothetical protein